MRLLIVGKDQPGHVGQFFYEAAIAEGWEVRILNVARAMNGNKWLRRVQWRLFRKPLRLNEFSEEVVREGKLFKPDIVLTTGSGALNAVSLMALRSRGIRLLNFSTDDPWNQHHRSRWFFEALCYYDHIYTPRRSNLDDLRGLGCRAISWLPFAYDPSIHYSEPNSDQGWSSDVAFVGGADRDRVPAMAALIAEKHDVSLWGGYWERFRETRSASQGFADPMTLRKVISSTRCALTLVRRSNRDGHAMRTYEVAAMGAPCLAEDTSEHREILGEEGKSVMYFSSAKELLAKSRWLVNNSQEGAKLGRELRLRICSGQNTYADRLKTIIEG